MKRFLLGLTALAVALPLFTQPAMAGGAQEEQEKKEKQVQEERALEEQQRMEETQAPGTESPEVQPSTSPESDIEMQEDTSDVEMQEDTSVSPSDYATPPEGIEESELEAE